MKRFWKHLYPTAIVLMFSLSGSLSYAQGIPENLQAAIFYKVLAYDYNIQTKAGSAVTIAVVTDTKTATRQAAILEGFNKLKGQLLNGKSINIAAVKVTGTNLGEAASADIIYLPDGADEKTVDAVIQLATKDKRATLGGSENLATKGCAIGLAVEAGKPKIVINLKAAQTQGMNLSSKVLRLAKVIQ
jgi:ABC-type uncharacterized transport system substrate-binding protein